MIEPAAPIRDSDRSRKPGLRHGLYCSLSFFSYGHCMFEEMQLRHTDVVIAGGGLAGSLAAAMLGRAGIDAVLVDPHPVYPPDFRCEKLDGVQLQTLS